ncbi:hypothetical protein FOMPIDRAFT_1039557 [Fomitopsis schrenkii]|uniref:BTB domain-containing protein n=1 Tax=Fomitopsis schrenkii TaxID=2126942 RepID=S8ENV0_FOMSC|nr:hypothetical protein FOMPIDRAFT_1039557 [Fomitopsis schrenkii]
MSAAEEVAEDKPASVSAKRPRLEDHDAAAGGTAREEFKQDAAFWYDDGNVILISNDNVGFRLYRGLLADRSTVFRDMFSLPQPPEAQSISGCPVVNLSDSSVVLKELLAELFHGKRYAIEGDIELDCLAYRIRVAHKYGFSEILKDSLEELKRLYPSTLADWEKIPHHDSARAITAVKLARLTNTLSILPSAVYSCCQIDEAVLLKGAAHPDGTVDVLSRNDLVMCMKARTQFTRLRIVYAMEVFRPYVLKCPACPNLICKGELNTMLVDVLAEHTRVEDKDAGLLGRWGDVVDAYVQKTKGPRKICEQCLTRVRKTISDLRKDEWEKLPVRMGLGHWARLVQGSDKA